MGKTLRANDARVNQQVYTLMVRKQELVSPGAAGGEASRPASSVAVFHVPLTIALLAALTAHIVSVFYYW